MNCGRAVHWICFGALAVAHAAASAQQPPWRPELVPPGAGAAAQSAPLRIHVAGIPADAPARLAVELDALDVTSLAVLDGTDIVITPAQPLAFGSHRLRLIENTPEGDIAERGEWRFDIRKSSAFRDASLAANVTANAVDRVADHNLTAAPGKLQGNGSAQVQAAVANDDWKASGTASIVANGQASQMPPPGNRIDLAQYLIAAQRGAVAGRMGDQTLGPDSLVMQGFARRGVSADLSGGIGHVTGFAMRTTPTSGSQDLSGLEDSRNRVNGAVASINPLPGRPGDLVLSGTYVDGEGKTQNGVGVAGVDQASGGNAGDVAADARLFDRLLRLRGEYAHSSFDFDGSGTGIDARSGRAYSGLANYTPWHDLVVLNQPLVWNLGAERKQISTFFHSPANPGMIADRDLGQAFTGLSWRGMNVQASAGREHDNVDDLALLPTTQSRQRALSLGYSPLQTPSPTGAPSNPWYGQPMLNASYMMLKRDLAINPGALPLAEGPLHQTRNLMFGAQFQYATGGWGLSRGIVTDNDFTGQAPDTRTVSDRVQTGMRLAKANVAAYLQHDQTDNLSLDTRTQAAIAGATLAYPFTTRVTSNLGYTVRHAWAQQTPSDEIDSDATFGVSWILVAAAGTRPGVAVGMDGSRHRCRDKSGSTGGTLSTFAACADTYQMFLKVSVSWMPTY